MAERPYSWLNPKLEIKETGKYGRGIFATESVKKGEVLIVMGGYICHTDQENLLGHFATDYNMDISEDWSFCPTKESDIEMMPQHLVNHSCEPNAGFSDSQFMVSIKNISAGEEVVYDYAFVMWSSPDSSIHFNLKCECGTSSCRGELAEDDWQNAKIQEKYGDYFQPFLRRKFKK